MARFGIDGRVNCAVYDWVFCMQSNCLRFYEKYGEIKAMLYLLSMERVTDNSNNVEAMMLKQGDSQIFISQRWYALSLV